MSLIPENKPPGIPGRPAGSPLRVGDGKAGSRRLSPQKVGSRYSQPVPPKRRPAVTLIGIVFCVVFILIFWYYGIILPAKNRRAAADAQLATAQQQRATEELKLQREKLELQMRQDAAARGGAIIKTVPPGATVKIGSLAPQVSPATFSGIEAGKYPLKITLDGYEDYLTDLEIKKGEVPELPPIALQRTCGGLNISSNYSDVTFSLNKGDAVVLSGKVPASLKDVPIGDYKLRVVRGDWEQAQPVTVKAKTATSISIPFNYGAVTIFSTPSGGMVHVGNKDLGPTPLTLNEVKPGLFTGSINLAKYKASNFSAQVDAGKLATVNVKLLENYDFANSIGMELVWLPDGFWAGKYEVTQDEYAAVMDMRPSKFSSGRRPVEQVSWLDAVAFCSKLTDMDRSAGKLPDGYHYSLPTERQWESLAADAKLEDAVTSRNVSRDSTAEVGSLGPNKYGIYDTRGNVWEWCFDSYDSSGQVHTMRGGSWLSATPQFTDISARDAARAEYKDKLIGFRCVLVKNSSK